MRGSPINRLEPLWPQSGESETIARQPATWGSTAKSWERSLEDTLAKYPKWARAAAAAAGLLLGWMVKRR
jgi:hypothetical protein